MKSAHLVVLSLVGLAACVSAGCSSNSNPASADSGADHPTSTPDAAGSDALQLPAELMSPQEPEVACSGSDTTACTLPASACAIYRTCDGSASACGAPWVVYYQNPHCMNGHCVWDENYFQCNGPAGCYNGGCQPVGTTTAVTAP
jgi:hypothetical protein